MYAKIGAKHEYIALEMDNSPNWIVAFWAILLSGNKPYLVNMRYPESLTNGILKTLNIKKILCDEKSQLNGEAVSLASLSGEYPNAPENEFENELAFSSSATSMNEVVCFFTGQQIAEQILNFKQIVKEEPRIAKHYKGQLKQLAFLPFYHVFGLFAVYFWFAFFGRTLVFLRDYSAETILKTCRRHNVTHIFALPMLWHTIEKQVRAEAKKQGEKKEATLNRALKFSTKLQNCFPGVGADIAKRLLGEVTNKIFGPSVMFCVNGGSYLRESAMELLNGIGYSMHNGYGMSEIGITSVELRRRPKDRNRNSVGHPFESVRYRIDAEGILQVKGTSICTKKIVNGETVLLNEWFDTGDRMTCVDGHYYILGRRSDTVIGENGENINPDTVEKAFFVDDVKMFSVLGLDGKNGQELSFVAQINPYTTENMADKIKKQVYAVNEAFPKTMAVKKFYFTFDEMAPPTAVKVSRVQLEKKIKDGQVKLIPFAEFSPKESENEGESLLMKQVVSIISRVLEVEESKISGTTHIFYDLDATSIQYFSIVSQLAEEFSITDYDDNDVYRYTPKEICEYIESKL